MATRVNVDRVPRLPTFPARWVLEDPRSRSYFVFWSDPGGKLVRALLMAPSDEELPEHRRVRRIGEKDSDERRQNHDIGLANAISASACPSQNRMSISRYIIAAVVKCSCACSRLPVRR